MMKIPFRQKILSWGEPIKELRRICQATRDTELYKTPWFDRVFFQGMLGILRKYKPSMFVEIHPPHVGGEPIIQFLEELKDLGYKTKYVIDKAFNYPIVKKKDAVETISLNAGWTGE